jgi:hypothetical protein
MLTDVLQDGEKSAQTRTHATQWLVSVVPTPVAVTQQRVREMSVGARLWPLCACWARATVSIAAGSGRSIVERRATRLVEAELAGALCHVTTTEVSRAERERSGMVMAAGRRSWATAKPARRV